MMMLDSFPPQIKSQLKLSDGLLLDLSGEGNVVTNYGATLTADHRGRANKAWNIDGTDKIDGLYNLSGATEFTVVIGIKPGNYIQYCHCNIYALGIYGSPDYFAIYLYQGRVVYVRFDVASAASGVYQIGSVDTTIYNHIVVTFNGSLTGNDKFKLYINGSSAIIDKLVATCTFTAVPNLLSPYLGKIYASQSMAYFMDDYQVLSRALSQSEISQLYNEWRK